ncbi:putative reverse transcriptase domain-containing protein, partial [Tanacetum coccineum]
GGSVSDIAYSSAKILDLNESEPRKSGYRGGFMDFEHDEKRMVLVMMVVMVVDRLHVGLQLMKEGLRKELCYIHKQTSTNKHPQNEVTCFDCFPSGTSCGRDGLRAQHLICCLSGAVVAISDELVASITQVVNLFLDGKCPKVLGEYIASAPLTSLVKPGGGIRSYSCGYYLEAFGFQGYTSCNNFRLIEGRGDDAGLSMLLVDFKNAFNLVDREVMLQEVCTYFPAISLWVEFCYTNPPRLYYGEHALRSCQGVQQGDPLGPFLFALVLHPLVCKIKDSFNLSLEAWYLDDGTIIGDTLVVGEVLKVIMEDGPRHGLHLNVDKLRFLCQIRTREAGISKLYFSMRTCSPHVFERAQRSFNVALCSALERIVTAFGPGFGDWQWRLSTLPFAFRGLVSTLQSQTEDHTSDWLRVVPISGLGQTMNGRTYRCVLCYRLGVPLFSVPKLCSACSKIFADDIFGDHVVSCAGIVGIKLA